MMLSERELVKLTPKQRVILLDLEDRIKACGCSLTGIYCSECRGTDIRRNELYLRWTAEKHGFNPNIRVVISLLENPRVKGTAEERIKYYSEESKSIPEIDRCINPECQSTQLIKTNHIIVCDECGKVAWEKEKI